MGGAIVESMINARRGSEVTLPVGGTIKPIKPLDGGDKVCPIIDTIKSIKGTRRGWTQKSYSVGGTNVKSVRTSDMGGAERCPVGEVKKDARIQMERRNQYNLCKKE